MRFRIFFITLSALLLISGVAEAHHILVVRSMRVKPYEEALRGFGRTCPSEMTHFILPEIQGNELADYIREERPRVIVAIGADALEQVKHVRDIPIVYLMVLNPHLIAHDRKNITGVRMRPSPEKHLELTMRALPGVRRIGMLYDPSRSSRFVQRALEAARSLGIELVAREVRSPREVPVILTRLRGEVDVMWMLPDATVITPETASFLLLFSGEHRIPVISFSGKYMEMGALMALEIDSYDMGMQAGELAQKILQGADVRTLPRADARKVTVKVNQSVARKMGLAISLPDAIVRSEP